LDLVTEKAGTWTEQKTLIKLEIYLALFRYDFRNKNLHWLIRTRDTNLVSWYWYIMWTQTWWPKYRVTNTIQFINSFLYVGCFGFKTCRTIYQLGSVHFLLKLSQKIIFFRIWVFICSVGMKFKFCRKLLSIYRWFWLFSFSAFFQWKTKMKIDELAGYSRALPHSLLARCLAHTQHPRNSLNSRFARASRTRFASRSLHAPDLLRASFQFASRLRWVPYCLITTGLRAWPEFWFLKIEEWKFSLFFWWNKPKDLKSNYVCIN
jgi:hypothetical protein